MGSQWKTRTTYGIEDTYVPCVDKLLGTLPRFQFDAMQELVHLPKITCTEQMRVAVKHAW